MTASIKQKITGCVFDLDGTLADTAPDIAQALNHALQDAGLVQLPLKSVVGMIGSGIPTLVRRALCYLDTGADLVEELVASMQAHYSKNYCDKSLLMDGVKDCLEGLIERGIPLAVCTNKEEEIAKMVVSALGIDKYFDIVVGSRLDLNKKPDPSMLFLAADEINSPLKTTMMIGDSEVDAATGIAANSVSVIIRGGYCHKPYEKLNVTHLLNNMDELLKIIDEQYVL
tara:strand:+ start:625 stop:1308 length:684 start_codon:yes stop_codon:yes gene_type:complete